MKPILLLLLLAVLLPLSGTAREETMEERKQRITRKYLRERLAVAESGMVVPGLTPEDERIADSEKYALAEVGIQREERTAMPMPPPPRRPVPQAGERNWLLAEADASADPYADLDSTKEAAKAEKGSKSWGFGREDDAYSASRRDSQSQPRGLLDPEPSPGPWSGASSGGRIYGQYPQESGVVPAPGVRDMGSSADAGLLKSPFTSRSSRPDEQSSERGAGLDGYVPYRSPFQAETDRQPRVQPGTQEPKEQFQRVQPYQQWKDRSKTWDPTKDDAYLDELMQRGRN